VPAFQYLRYCTFSLENPAYCWFVQFLARIDFGKYLVLPGMGAESSFAWSHKIFGKNLFTDNIFVDDTTLIGYIFTNRGKKGEVYNE